MRYIIFGTKSQRLGLKISTHISNWKVMMSWCWIIKQPDPKPISDKSVVYFFQNPVVQTIIIKWKKIYDVLWCHIWWKSSSSKIKSNFAEILSVLSLKPLKTQKKRLGARCTSLLRMATNGDVTPSLWYVVRISVLHVWHIKRTLSLVPLNWLLSLSSSSDFSSWVILY